MSRIWSIAKRRLRWFRARRDRGRQPGGAISRPNRKSLTKVVTNLQFTHPSASNTHLLCARDAAARASRPGRSRASGWS